MVVISSGIAEVVLGVVDDGVIPIGNIDRAIGAGLNIDGAEIGMPGADEGSEDLGAESGSILDEFIAHHAATFESSGEELSAKIVANVSAGREVSPALLVGADQGRNGGGMTAVSRGGREIHDAGIVDHEGLAPAIEDVAPRVAAGAGAEESQFLGAGIVLVDAAVEITNETVLGFDLGMEEDAFLEVDPTAGTTTPGADRVVAVFNAEAGEGELLEVGNIVAVGVFEKEDIRGLANVASAVGEFDSGGEVESLREDGRLIGSAIVVGVFENDDLVVGGIARFELGVGPGAGNPEAAFGIPSHVDRVGEHGIGGEEIGFVAGQEFKVFQFRSRVVIVHQGEISALEVARLDAFDVLSV